MKLKIGILVALIALVGVLYWYSTHADKVGMTAEQLKALGLVELPEPTEIGELTLVDQDGRPFDGSVLQGKWSYAFFGYTNCPDICPITMSLLKQVEQRLHETASPDVAAKFQGIFVTVDPARDSPETVREFVASFSPNFLGVTGTEENIRSLASNVAVGYRRIGSDDSKIEYLVEHQGHIVVFSPEGRCYGFIKPEHDTTQLVRIFLHLEKKASSAVNVAQFDRV